MSEHVILSLDFGTTFCKCYAHDGKKPLYESRTPVAVSRPAPGVSELNPEDWKEAALTVLKDTAAHLSEKDTVIALGVSTSGPGIILADAEGNALLPSPNWQDGRCAAEGKELFETIGYQWVGQGLPVTSGAARVLWYARHTPEQFQKAARIQDNKGFVLSFLTGNRFTDISCSGRMPYDWTKDLARITGASESCFDEVLPIEGCAGVLRPEIAEACGLKKGIPVFCGLNDGAAAVLGTGTLTKNSGVVSISTNGVARILTDRKPDGKWLSDHGFFCTKYVKDLWVLGGFTKTAGDSVDWFSSLMYRDTPEEKRAKLLDQEAAEAGSSEGLLYIPGLYGMGSPTPTSVPCGAFLHLSRSHERKHFSRALLEGISFSVRSIGEAFSETGLQWNDVYCTGGGIKSRIWLQILSDVLGRKLIPSSTDSSLGAAMSAAVAAGLYSTYEEAASVMMPPHTETVCPGDSASSYDPIYETYKLAVKTIIPGGKL